MFLTSGALASVPLVAFRTAVPQHGRLKRLKGLYFKH